MPDTLSGKLGVWKYLILRRITQLSTLLLFFGSAHWAWNYNELPVISGNLSSSLLLGFIPLADPFAVLQILATQNTLLSEVLTGTLIVLAFYFIAGGRVWCSWVCPINMVSDLASRVRRKLNIQNAVQISRRFRYTILVLALVLSAITGVAAFEWISPISIFHREVIFGLGSGWAILLGIFIFDAFILKDGWCGHLCPLGAFYSIVGRFSLLRIKFDAPTCTHCVECVTVCPEPQVLDFKQATSKGYISAGECTNCARCIGVCPENTLKFDLKPWIKKQELTINNQQNLTTKTDNLNETDHGRKIA
ncbi:MAG: quinol dehydrogenase ferredoxin subunit NapH [Gammaproteobacteria bacterium]|nr:quinol dehydrogenase ferredoxin subunit NapH [Gammaproteobacteria bacterium]MBL6999691.1 quinol dehydrogenase ferredoxin subunit NapH [Gammaproteobacteria bacterium]